MTNPPGVTPAGPTRSGTPLPRILVLNGPNLNLLGTREPSLYGHDTLADAEKLAVEAGARAGVAVECLQSNHEGVLIDRIQAARGTAADAEGAVAGIVLNAGGLTHTSVALRDALAAVAIPFVEVHVSNVHAREEFRHHSFLSANASAVIVGAGIAGYGWAVELLARRTAAAS
ncbi:type II 3-dehydroquinate dehydratase [Herbiconiux sp. YIM B11900]|uniref:type II 3-dehydroquinate dehydratase n=1 Tax=Herbiconiux sp. YIM B11900 TaxID=3404131 RepID=UPI003F8583A1